MSSESELWPFSITGLQFFIMEHFFLRVSQARVKRSFSLLLNHFREMDKYSQAVNALWSTADLSTMCVLLSPGDSGDRLLSVFKLKNIYVCMYVHVYMYIYNFFFTSSLFLNFDLMGQEKEQKNFYLHNFIDVKGSKWKINSKRVLAVKSSHSRPAGGFTSSRLEQMLTLNLSLFPVSSHSTGANTLRVCVWMFGPVNYVNRL